MKSRCILSLVALAGAGLLLGGSESRAASLPATAQTIANNLPYGVTFDANTDFPTVLTFTNIIASGDSAPNLSNINVFAESPNGSTDSTAVPPFGYNLQGIGSAGLISVSGGPNLTSQLEVDSNFLRPEGGLPFEAVTLTVSGVVVTGTGSTVVTTEQLFDLSSGTSVPDGSLSVTGNGSMSINLPTPTPELGSIKIHKGTTGPGGGSVFCPQVIDTAQFTQVSVSVPEPASVLMLGCGLVVVVGLSLRRSRRTAGLATP